MRIVGLAVSRELGVFSSLGEWHEKSPYLSLLLRNYGRDTIKVLANIDYDVSALLPLLNMTNKELEKLAREKRVFLAPYKLTYYPDRFFSVAEGFGRGRISASFSDMSQYEPRLSTIEDSKDPTYFMSRAKLAQETGEKVYESMVRLGYHPEGLVSPVNVFRKEAMPDSLPTMVSLDLTPEEKASLTAYSYECCHGSLVESYKKGHFSKATDLDINTAYASVAAQLLHPAYGHWLYSKEYQPDATYGYCQCEVMIDSNFSPIIYSVDAFRSFTPKGIWVTYLTKGEIDFIHKYNLGYATVLSGWYWFKDKEVRPLEDIIKKLYAQKQAATGLDRDIMKRLMAGAFYGLFIEVRATGEPGQYFYPPWAAEAEAQTRLEVARFVLDNQLQDRLLSVAVDGVIVEGDVAVESSDEMGRWRVSHQGRCIVASTGVIGMEDKYGYGDFSLSYEKLAQLLDSDSSRWNLSKLSVKTLGMCHGENNYEDLGKVFKLTRSIDLREAKRLFLKEPATGRELLAGQYSSEPWSVGIVRLMTEKKLAAGDNL